MWADRIEHGDMSIPFEMDVSTHPPDYAVLSPHGELDVANAPCFRQSLLELVATSVPLIIVDLSGVSFIDSSGLGAILTGWREMTLTGGLLVVAAPPRISRVFEITGMDLSIQVMASTEQALAAAGLPSDSPESDLVPPLSPAT
jgi:anti-sigma B factor antagonist